MLRIYLLLALLLTNTIAYSQKAIDYDKIDIYLHTVDVGTPLAEKYGHVQMRVRQKNGPDSTYSWGLYSFDEGFLLKFVRGILNYRIGSFSTGDAMRFYKHDGRTVWEDKLNLTALQKKKLLDSIQTQLLPENRVYSYHYFFDNCSTRPRDLINDAVFGQFFARLDGKFSSDSFRESVRRHQATTPISGLGLEIIMNSRLDRRMTKWEEMYLPKSLRRYLLEMPQVDDNGNVIQHTSLLSPKGTLANSPTPVANYWRDYFIMWGILALLLLALALLFRSSNPSKWLLFIWSDIIAGWGFIGMFFGSYMLFSSLFSEIKDVQYSANQWIFWPTDILYLVWGIVGMKRRTLPVANRWTSFMIRYTQIHILGFILLILLALVGVITQDVWRVVMTFGFCALVVQIGFLRLAGWQKRYKLK